MSPEQFRLACLFRLGLKLPVVPSFCRACHAQIDPNGIHLFSCVHYRQLLTHRHDAIVRDLKELASQAGVQAQDKNLTLFRVEDEEDGHRPDLLLKNHGTNGRDLYLDITVSHPTCSSYVGSASKERGFTIMKKIKEKNDKYKQKCENLGHCFLPLAFESYGLASKDVVEVISSLAEKASDLLCIPYAL